MRLSMSAFSATNRIHFLQSAPVISLRRHAVVHVTKRIAESDATVPEVKACIAALRLMLQILNWEFQYNTTSSKAGINAFSSGVTADCSSPKRSECILVQPGPAWQDVLILSGHIAWLLGFYAALREKFSRGVYWLDCPLAVSARKLIVQLCSLTGTVFHSSLPPRYRDSVRAITPGLPLFLYNYTTHQLHGIFEAASFGGSNIDPTAWEDKKCKGESRFPAQVNIALEEDSFRLVLHHYDGPKFRLELSVPETLDLLDLCEQTGSST